MSKKAIEVNSLVVQHNRSRLPLSGPLRSHPENRNSLMFFDVFGESPLLHPIFVHSLSKVRSEPMIRNDFRKAYVATKPVCFMIAITSFSFKFSSRYRWVICERRISHSAFDRPERGLVPGGCWFMVATLPKRETLVILPDWRLAADVVNRATRMSTALIMECEAGTERTGCTQKLIEERRHTLDICRPQSTALPSISRSKSTRG